MTKQNILDTLKQRGYVKQTVFEDELYDLLGKESVTFYIGFDPTADSLHIGSFVQLMAMAHMQRAGHKPIALIGGGTGMVGDPSGKTDMRSMMTAEIVNNNCAKLKEQIGKFISFSDGKAIAENNADWLLSLNYVDFLREVGVHFSVNRMLTAECFKQRMENGLSFFEFNYMLMQAYDFLVMNRKHNCKLQIGGDDQWSNILAGADLVRRKEGKTVFALTLTLLLTGDGTKMGKTAKGAIWLDGEKTPPYELFQYFRNIGDVEVENCLKLLTFMDLKEIEELVKYKDNRINEAKRVLAYEVTKLIHGQEAADEANRQALAAFSNDAENMPSMEIENCISVIDALIAAKLAASKSEARRLLEGGGVKINDTVANVNHTITDLIGTEKQFVLHKGKKVHINIILK